MRRITPLALLLFAACGTEGTQLLGFDDPEPEVLPEPETPETPETGTSARGLLVYGESGDVIGHLVVDDDTSGVMLLGRAIHPVQIELTDNGMRVTGFQPENHEDTLFTEISDLRVAWTGDGFGAGEGMIEGETKFCDIDYCLDPEPFVQRVRVGLVDGVAELSVTLPNDEYPGMFFPSDKLKIHFDRFMDLGVVSQRLEVSVNGERLEGDVEIVSAAGRRVAAAVFTPARPLPMWYHLTITVPGATVAMPRIIQDPGSIFANGNLSMWSWAASDPESFAYEFNCLEAAPQTGPLLIVRSGAGGFQRAYSYVDFDGTGSIVLDVLSASSWRVEPSMARILVNDRVVYEHGSMPPLRDDAQCAEGGRPGDFYETLSGGGPVQIPLDGTPGERLHIVVESHSTGVTPSAAIVVGMFAAP